MSSPRKSRPFRAAFWLTGTRRSQPILPLRSVVGLAIALAGLLVIAWLVDRELGKLASKGIVATPAWYVDNQLISAENYRKIRNSFDEPVFRSLGYSPPKVAPDRNRVLVIGDSFIWGDGLTNINQTWWRQLQLELERRGYAGVDVIAAGVNGASTQDEFRWLTQGKLLEKTQPSVVIVGYVTNDPQMKDASGKDLVKQFAPAPGALAWTPPLLPRILPNLWGQLAVRRIQKVQSTWDGEGGYPYELWELKLLEGENFLRYQALLVDLRNTVKQAKLPIFFVTTPNEPNADRFEARHAPVRRAFQEAGLVMHDLLPPLLECCKTLTSNLIWGANPVNSHPGPRMTHFYATHVADILERDYPSALGPRSMTGCRPRSGPGPSRPMRGNSMSRAIKHNCFPCRWRSRIPC
jgi:lysophospholipase L1-like esterase